MDRTALHANRKDTLAKYVELFGEFDELRRLPPYDPHRVRAINSLLEQWEYPGVPHRYWLLTGVIAGMNWIDIAFRESAMAQVATRTLVAVLRYRADHERLPASLDALVPDYLRDAPEDVFSADPLKYSHDDADRISLYSVGRNLIDDGGVSDIVKNAKVSGLKAPADIVYWPPEGK